MKLTAAIALVLTFVVIMLGAYVRLSHAGLGCPDWPGCYGQLDWPAEPHEVEQANAAFPERPVEAGKAWKEMVHRYLAGTLGLLVLLLTILNFRREPRFRQSPLVLTLAAVIIFQALLGMWTVTLLLKPLIVMGHLLGGLATMVILTLLNVRLRYTRLAELRMSNSLPTLALIVLISQIALGGWTSSNYAAMACPDFPTCQQQWWPEEANFGEGFVLWRGLGIDYEGGVLEHPARVAIHFTHRLGALLTFAVLSLLAWRMSRSPFHRTRSWSAALFVTLCAQFSLGVLNVMLSLPLPLAVLHNGVAALLLFILVNIYVRSHDA